MKKKIIAPLAFAFLMGLAGCDKTNVTDSSSILPSTPTSSQTSSEGGSNEVTKYAITVRAPSAVHYSLSEREAEEGAKVSLSINSIDAGFELQSVSLDGEALTGVENVYTFQMPAKAVTLTVELVEIYNVRVSAPTGLSYTLDKESAKAGETVTLTLTPGAFQIEEVTLNGTAIEGKNNVYAFQMPDRTANIAIKASISGEVVLTGDVVASLTKGEDGIYVARGIKVPEGSGDANFSFSVGGTKLSVSELDETRTFADVSFPYGSKYTEKLLLKRGATYDFFYDPSDAFPCYIQKVSVETLPSSVETLETLFGGSVRSENTENPANLTGINLAIYKNDGTASRINYDYDVFENSTLATVTNVLSDETYYSYKAVDSAKNVLKVVETFPSSLGNEDRSRETNANLGGNYAATYDLVKTEEESSRFKKSPHDVRFALTNSAYTYYNLEHLFMDSYRVGFSVDEVSFKDIDIKSVKSETGFSVTINSTCEFNSSAGTYTQEMHEADVYDVKLDFLKNGALSAIDYKSTNYQKASWDFVSHTPLASGTGTVTKTVKGTLSYGEKKGETTFDTTPYFIQGFSTLHFYNSLTEKADDPTKNQLHYNDKIRVTKISENDDMSLTTVKTNPATALDIWQYAPTESDNEAVVKRLDTDTYNQMTCVGMGEANVTFTNHTGDSARQSAKIEVSAAAKFHSVYLYEGNGDDYGNVLTANSAILVAGQITKFHLGVSPAKAPIVYEASSSDPRVKILTHDATLTLDATAAADITETKNVTIRIRSEYLDTSTGRDYLDLTFYLTPSSIEPSGIWNLLNEDGTQDTTTYLDFSGEAATNEGWKKGTLHETFNNLVYEYSFEYKLEKGKLLAHITSVKPGKDDVPTDASSYTMEFYFDATSGRFGLYLGYVIADDEGNAVPNDILGSTDGEGWVSAYAAFEEAQ